MYAVFSWSYCVHYVLRTGAHRTRCVGRFSAVALVSDTAQESAHRRTWCGAEPKPCPSQPYSLMRMPLSVRVPLSSVISTVASSSILYRFSAKMCRISIIRCDSSVRTMLQIPEMRSRFAKSSMSVRTSISRTMYSGALQLRLMR